MMTLHQALEIIGSIPEGREALQCLIDENGWYIEYWEIFDFLDEQ